MGKWVIAAVLLAGCASQRSEERPVSTCAEWLKAHLSQSEDVLVELNAVGMHPSSPSRLYRLIAFHGDRSDCADGAAQSEYLATLVELRQVNAALQMVGTLQQTPIEQWPVPSLTLPDLAQLGLIEARLQIAPFHVSAWNRHTAIRYRDHKARLYTALDSIAAVWRASLVRHVEMMHSADATRAAEIATTLTHILVGLDLTPEERDPAVPLVQWALQAPESALEKRAMEIAAGTIPFETTTIPGLAKLEALTYARVERALRAL